MTDEENLAIKASVDNAIAAVEAVRSHVDRLLDVVSNLSRDNDRLVGLSGQPSALQAQPVAPGTEGQAQPVGPEAQPQPVEQTTDEQPVEETGVEETGKSTPRKKTS